MSAASSDSNLLFGILALQVNFLTGDALIRGMRAWVMEKHRPLGAILIEQGLLRPEQQAVLQEIVRLHLETHDHDAQKSLARVCTIGPIRADLEEIADPDVQASVAQVGPTPAIEGGRPRSANGPPPAPGVRYRKIRPHARGGLGEVFVAVDEELQREVALKEIQDQHADCEDNRTRFLREAEITGKLEHPGIVPVHGLGFYPDGRPFYAMRFIRGQSLQEAIDRFHKADGPRRDPGERTVEMRQLLGRFIDVCNAVAYAHSRGVLHRDLKPSNVMLGQYGETLVVDWGLARLLTAGADGTEAAESLHLTAAGTGMATQMGQFMGTPAFASPEQATGQLDQLEPASDVYSLGAILYTLLAGKKPFTGTNAREVLQRVERGELIPPRQVKAAVPAALDAVCLKAMARVPADRYTNALALAADVERWLAEEPVSAYPEPLSIRAARWVRRHRTAVVAAVVFLVSAVVGLAGTTALVWREEQKVAAQKRLAEENYELARDMGFRSLGLLEEAEPAIASVPALLPARMDLLDASARAFRHFLEHQPDDPELRLRTAQIDRYAANVHRLAGQAEEAEPLYADAIGLLEGLVEKHPAEMVYRQKLAETLRDRASLQARMGRLTAATETLRRAIRTSEELLPANPSPGPASRELATALLDLSQVEYARGQIAESGKIADRAVLLFRARLRLPAEKPHAYDPLLYAAALNQVAVTARDQGRIAAARAAHASAVKLLRGVVGKRDGRLNPDDVLDVLARCVLEQSRTLARSGATRPLAEKNLGQAALQWQELGKRHPKVAAYRARQAVAFQVRAEVRMALKRLAEARADLEASRQLLEGLVKESRGSASARGDLGRTYLGLGRLARQAGERDAAATWFSKAQTALRQALERAPEVAQDQRSLKEVQAEQAGR